MQTEHEALRFPAGEGVVPPVVWGLQHVLYVSITSLLGQYQSGKSTGTVVLMDVKSVFSQRQTSTITIFKCQHSGKGGRHSYFYY